MNYDEVIPSKVHRQEVKVYKVPPLKLKTHTKNYSTNLSFKYSQPHRGGLLVFIRCGVTLLVKAKNRLFYGEKLLSSHVTTHIRVHYWNALHSPHRLE